MQDRREVVLIAGIMLASALMSAAPTACGQGMLKLGAADIYADHRGEGRYTVLLEAGNGADSSVWNALEPQIRADQVATLRYDRVGYGQSEPRRQGSYNVEQDLQIVQSLLDRCVGDGPVIYVAHSYGGVLALLTTKRDVRIRAVVLVDTVAPGVESVAAVQAQRAQLRKQYDEVRRQAPQLAAALLPVVEALPDTVATINQTVISPDLPIIDIVATGGHDGDGPRIAQWLKGHERFVAEAPLARALVEATGSGHQVMRDRPDLVTSAIREALRRLAKD